MRIYAQTENRASSDMNASSSTPSHQTKKSSFVQGPPLLRLVQNLQYHLFQREGAEPSLQRLLEKALIAYAKQLGVEIPEGVE